MYIREGGSTRITIGTTLVKSIRAFRHYPSTKSCFKNRFLEVMRKLVRFAATALNNLLLLSKHQYLFYPCSSQGYFLNVLPNKKYICLVVEHIITFTQYASDYANVCTFLLIKFTQQHSMVTNQT